MMYCLRVAVAAAALAVLSTPSASVNALTLSTPRSFLDFQIDPPTSPDQTPPNWSAYTQSQAHAGATIELKDEFGSHTGINFHWQRNPSNGTAMQNQPVATGVAPTGIDLAPFGENIQASFLNEGIVLEGLTPGRDYLFWLITWTLPTPGPLPPMNMNVSGVDGWSRIETPPDSILAINGVKTDADHTFESYAERFTALPPGKLEIINSDGQFTGIYGFVLQPVPEPSAFVVAVASLFGLSLLWQRGQCS